MPRHQKHPPGHPPCFECQVSPEILPKLESVSVTFCICRVSVAGVGKAIILTFSRSSNIEELSGYQITSLRTTSSFQSTYCQLYVDLNIPNQLSTFVENCFHITAF